MDRKELKEMLKEIQNEEVEKQKAEKEVEVKDVNSIVDKLGEKIVEAIKEAKGVSEKDAKDFQSEFFNKENGMKGIQYPELNKLSSLSKDEKIVTWFKALVNKDKDPQAFATFKALVEGTDAQGGYLVPEELRTEVYRILPDVALMRKLALVLPMNTDTLNLSTLLTSPEAYWTAEYASKSTTSATFGRVTLNPTDLVCLLPVTHQLLNDANINLVQFIVQLFTEAIAKAEDKAFFTGSGTGQPKGINQETLTSINAGGTGDFDDVSSLMYRVPQSVRSSPRAAFVAHYRVIDLLRKVKDTTGRYIWEPSVQVGTPERVMGKPIYEQNDLGTNELYFGDWSGYVIGDRQQIVVETTTEGGESWRRNSMEIKAVERVDGTCALTGKFAKITNF